MKIIYERQRCDTRCAVTISDIYIIHNTMKPVNSGHALNSGQND